MEGGGEEMRVEASAYGETVANKEAKNKATIKFDKETDNKKKGRNANEVRMANIEAKNKAKTKFGRTGIQSGWKMIGLVFRPERKLT
jgi:hypothetical protein